MQYFSKARFERVPLPRERGWRVELGAINREIVQSSDILITDAYASALKPRATGTDNYSNRFFKQTGLSIDAIVGKPLQDFAAAGLMIDDGYRIRLSREGLFVSDSLWPHFLK